MTKPQLNIDSTEMYPYGDTLNRGKRGYKNPV